MHIIQDQMISQQSNDAMNFLPQSKYLLDMSYLRVKNITLGYTFPTDLTQKDICRSIQNIF